MWAGVVDGVEGSVDIKQGNQDSLNFDGPSSSWRNVVYCRDGNKSRHALILLLGRAADGIGTFHRLVSNLISTEAYGIEKVRVPILHPGPLTQGASVGNEVAAWK